MIRWCVQYSARDSNELWIIEPLGKYSKLRAFRATKSVSRASTSPLSHQACYSPEYYTSVQYYCSTVLLSSTVNQKTEKNDTMTLAYRRNTTYSYPIHVTRTRTVLWKILEIIQAEATFAISERESVKVQKVRKEVLFLEFCFHLIPYPSLHYITFV